MSYGSVKNNKNHFVHKLQPTLYQDLPLRYKILIMKTPSFFY